MQFLFAESNLNPGLQVLQSSVTTPITGVGLLSEHPTEKEWHL